MKWPLGIIGLAMLKQGDPVKIKVQWVEKGAEYLTYVAAEDQVEGQDNIKIMATNSRLTFPPIESIELSMLEGF